MALTRLNNRSVSAVTSYALDAYDLPIGSIVQVVQDLDTYTTTTSGATFTDTNLVATITPSVSTNKILVIAHVHGTCNNENYSTAFRFLRNGSPVGVGDQVGSNRPRASFMHSQNGGGDHQTTASNMYLDSPNTTSALTYKVQVATEAGAYFKTNSNYNAFSDTTDPKMSVSMCSLTLLEVKA